MPWRTPRACAVANCPNQVIEGSRCAEHRLPKVDARPTAAQRGYDWGWKQRRDVWLRLHPWCCDPYGVHAGVRVRATVVDHVVPKSMGGADEESNYQSLCDKCHAVKGTKDGTRRGRGGWHAKS